MEDLKAIIESLLFVADRPMSVEKLADIIEEADPKAIRATLQELLGEFDNPGRGFRLREVAGGYQFRTHPECQAYIKRMLKPAPSRLSRAALETLAIIAYKQPIIRSDVEHIRGVDSGGVLRVLMEKKLVRVLGRREIPGRPLIYATTKHFLEVFDLKNLKDLPTPKEIEELTAQEPDLDLEGVEEQAAAEQAPPSAPAAEDDAPGKVSGGVDDAVAGRDDTETEGREAGEDETSLSPIAAAEAFGTESQPLPAESRPFQAPAEATPPTTENRAPEPGEAPITGPDRVDHDALAADENNNENPEGGEGGETAHGGAGSAPRDGERPDGEGERET